MKVVGGDADKFSTSLPESQFKECADMVNMLDYQERRFQGLFKKAGMNHSDWLKDYSMFNSYNLRTQMESGGSPEIRKIYCTD